MLVAKPIADIPAEQLADVLARAASRTATHAVIEVDAYREVLAKHRPARVSTGEPPKPVPRAEWPAWVRVVRLLAGDRDKGIGDTVQRYAAKIGGEAFKAWAESIGLPCGCSDRQLEWNTKYPYRPAD